MTVTYGFRHADASLDVFPELAQESGVLEVVHTEDVSLLTAENLRDYDAVYFFTSGELPVDFVRSGKGFGGSHSPTDCNCSWPEYGEMIGGYFDLTGLGGTDPQLRNAAALYQINAQLRADSPASFEIVVEAGGRRSNSFQFRR